MDEDKKGEDNEENGQQEEGEGTQEQERGKREGEGRGNKKNPARGSGTNAEAGLRGGQGERTGGSSLVGSDPLNLRGSSANTERAKEKNRLAAMDNLLDISGLSDKE